MRQLHRESSLVRPCAARQVRPAGLAPSAQQAGKSPEDVKCNRRPAGMRVNCYQRKPSRARSTTPPRRLRGWCSCTARANACEASRHVPSRTAPLPRMARLPCLPAPLPGPSHPSVLGVTFVRGRRSRLTPRGGNPASPRVPAEDSPPSIPASGTLPRARLAWLHRGSAE